MEFETIVNPPQEVFNQIVKLTGETEGWGFQLNDYDFWKSAFDQFWLFTVVEKGTSNLVASVSLARWDSDTDGPLYSVGMYYCTQKYRGQGHGPSIFKRAMEIVGDANATLTGVTKMWHRYSNTFGFKEYPDHWHLSSSIQLKDLQIPEQISSKYYTKTFADFDRQKIHAYDKTICSRNRQEIMDPWFDLKDTFSQLVLNSENQIVGYATIRIVSMNKLSVAPFYAENLEAAEFLFSSLLQSIPNLQSYSSIGFLFPENNRDALRLCQKFAKDNKYTSAPFIKSQFTKKFITSPDQKVYSMSDCAHQFV